VRRSKAKKIEGVERERRRGVEEMEDDLRDIKLRKDDK